VNFVDGILVRLATGPAGVFDQLSLEHLLRAAYDTANATLAGPFNAAFESLRLGVAVPRTAIAQGAWGASGTPAIEGRWELSGLGGDGTLLVDALWRGAIVARTAAPTGRIADVGTAWPTASGIDEEIVAALGALPADSAAREQQRRTRYRARLRAALAQPDALTDEALDRWLREAGAGSVGELIERSAGTTFFGATRVTYVETAAPPPVPRVMPVAVALLIRDVGFSLAGLLAQSKQVRELLEPLAGRADKSGGRLRHPLVIGWVVPAAVFNDADWPTETNPPNPADQVRERRQVAGRWLSDEGIGLIVS